MKRIALILCCAFVAVLGTTTAGFAGTCSAWQDCSDGSTVDCSGTSSCIVGSDYVECDGVRNSCSDICDASLICPSPPFSQAWYIECTANSSTDTCTEGTDYVRCGTEYVYCEDCESGPVFCVSAN